MKVACTVSGASVLGSTCRASSAGVRAPSATAASTYGSSRMLRTTERTRRTTRGTSGMTMATITVRSPARDSETSPMANRMAGMDMSPSITRITISSSQRT